jgi:hypothetical protein
MNQPPNRSTMMSRRWKLGRHLPAEVAGLSVVRRQDADPAKQDRNHRFLKRAPLGATARLAANQLYKLGSDHLAIEKLRKRTVKRPIRNNESGVFSATPHADHEFGQKEVTVRRRVLARVVLDS